MKDSFIPYAETRDPVALFVDGENLSPTHAEAIIDIAERFGRRGVRRVYGEAARLQGWRVQGTLRVIDACQGKNVTDMLLSLEALEAALCGRARTIAIASSDRDFAPLALKLAEHGVRVIGIGEDKGNRSFRDACDVFEVLPVLASPDPQSASRKRTATLDAEIRDIIRAQGGKEGCRIADLNALLRRGRNFRISDADPAHTTWRGYLAARSGIFDLDPKGPEARVRLKHKS